MKKMFMLALVAMLGVQTQAQIVSSRSSMTTRQVIEEPKTFDGWSTLYFQWNPMSLSPKHGDSESFTGFSFGYSKATSLTQSLPLFLESGLGVQYSYWSGEWYTDDDEMNLLSAKIPVSVMYKYDIPNTSISIVPNLGLDLRFNILGNANIDDEDFNLFDEDDMGEDNAWSRFQIGWHIGVNAMFNNKFMLGVSYGTDFSKIWDEADAKFNTASITLGYCF